VHTTPSTPATTHSIDDTTGDVRKGFFFPRRARGGAEHDEQAVIDRVEQLVREIDDVVDAASAAGIEPTRVALGVPAPTAQPIELPAPGEASTHSTQIQLVPGEAGHIVDAPAIDIATPAPGSAAHAVAVQTERILAAVEAEASRVRERVDSEIQHAEERAAGIRQAANSEATELRASAQEQARLLLGEVENIISEAQRSSQDILSRARSDANALTGEAGDVLAAAREEARIMLEQARREGEEILSEQRRIATVRAQEAMREQDRLRTQIQRLEERRRQVLESLEPLVTQLTQLVPAALDRAGVDTAHTE
jgi:cell division septum initiation protein DivIVA